MEHTLGVPQELGAKLENGGLNPCFSGTYSRRANNMLKDDQVAVLILVLVEHTLGGIRHGINQ